MLNAHVGLVAVRDAHRHGAGVETPAIVERHERVEYEAAVTLAVWRKQQHTIPRHLLQGANGIAPGIARGAFGASATVYTVPSLTSYTHMVDTSSVIGGILGPLTGGHKPL